MESLQIRTGEIRLQVLDDAGEPRGIFKFNPHDIESAKRVFALQDEIDEKQKEFDKKIEACKTTQEQIELLSETVTYFKGLVDICFGNGSSEVLFGNNNSLSMFNDFFEGIIPYYTNASAKRIAKYNKPKKSSK